MKKGLVLEGGAMRGMFTAGVIDVMMENGIEYDGAVGVSAGAAFGCNYKSKQIGRVIRYNKRFCKDDRYCSFRSLVKTGNLYGAQFCYHDLPENYDPMDEYTYEHNPMKFYAVCTDMESGKPFYRDCDVISYENLEYIRASASMPVVSRPVELNGHKYLDGGISDSIPIKWMEEQGYERNVVVLTRPLDYVKNPQVFMKTIELIYKDYPRLVEDLKNRHIVYQETIDYILRKEKEGKIFVIRPEKKLEIRRTENDPEVLQKVYDLGRNTMKQHIDSLQEYLNKE